MTLNDLLTVVDRCALRLTVPVTPRLDAQFTIDLRDAAQLDDMASRYGERAVREARALAGSPATLHITLA